MEVLGEVPELERLLFIVDELGLSDCVRVRPSADTCGISSNSLQTADVFVAPQVLVGSG